MHEARIGTKTWITTTLITAAAAAVVVCGQVTQAYLWDQARLRDRAYLSDPGLSEPMAINVRVEQE